ncbi:CSEP0045 putative effector protein [Erysiphe neolycopersici]|uniref:CSEP0045 putative effector protein n=1 Tax=Erysiphe neolycopersici TaxID=212602 RepID=A0A420HCG3_9PEZI|nr:CSEP0045 putative effector protein [Erysiphe neolycopersici]
MILLSNPLICIITETFRFLVKFDINPDCFLVAVTMYFSSTPIFIALLGYQLVAAEIYKNIYCVSVKSRSDVKDDVKSSNNDWIPNDEATEQACSSYKRRNEGNKEHWERCPDCETTILNEVLQCKSHTARINDIYFQEYCKLFGASYSEPRATGKISWWSTLKQRLKTFFAWK